MAKKGPAAIFEMLWIRSACSGPSGMSPSCKLACLVIWEQLLLVVIICPAREISDSKAREAIDQWLVLLLLRTSFQTVVRSICRRKPRYCPAHRRLAERKLRFDQPELAQEWDTIQHRERQAAIPNIEQNRSIEEGLSRPLLRFGYPLRPLSWSQRPIIAFGLNRCAVCSGTRFR
jgi:hypothetical protein